MAVYMGAGPSVMYATRVLDLSCRPTSDRANCFGPKRIYAGSLHLSKVTYTVANTTL